MVTDAKPTPELLEAVTAECIERRGRLDGWEKRLSEFRGAWDGSPRARRLLRRLFLATVEDGHPDEFFSLCLTTMLMLGWEARGRFEECVSSGPVAGAREAAIN